MSTKKLSLLFAVGALTFGTNMVSANDDSTFDLSNITDEKQITDMQHQLEKNMEDAKTEGDMTKVKGQIQILREAIQKLRERKNFEGEMAIKIRNEMLQKLRLQRKENKQKQEENLQEHRDAKHEELQRFRDTKNSTREDFRDEKHDTRQDFRDEKHDNRQDFRDNKLEDRKEHRDIKHEELKQYRSGEKLNEDLVVHRDNKHEELQRFRDQKHDTRQDFRDEKHDTLQDFRDEKHDTLQDFRDNKLEDRKEHRDNKHEELKDYRSDKHAITNNGKKEIKKLKDLIEENKNNKIDSLSALDLEIAELKAEMQKIREEEKLDKEFNTGNGSGEGNSFDLDKFLDSDDSDDEEWVANMPDFLINP